MNRVRRTMRMEREMWEKVKAEAAKKGMHAYELVERAILRYAEKERRIKERILRPGPRKEEKDVIAVCILVRPSVWQLAKEEAQREGIKVREWIRRAVKACVR